MNNIWLKKYEESVTDIRKEKTMERQFPSEPFEHFNNDKECFALSHFIFTNQNQDFVSVSSTVSSSSCEWGQVSHDYIKRDLGEPNFAFTTIVIPIVLCRTAVVHLKNL